METTAEKQQAAAPAATDPEKQGAATAEATSKTAPRRCRGGDDDEAQAQQLAALKWQKLAEGDKAEAGKAKRIGRVSQRYIDILLREKATATGGVYRPSRSMEYLAMYKGPHEAELRALVARSNAARERLRAGDAAILEQYHRLGYAYSEVEED